jgi:hypothetical protein
MTRAANFLSLKRLIEFPVLCALLMIFAPRIAAAPDNPDFSGSYTLKSAKGGDAPDKGEVWTLQIIQSETEIKIITIIEGHPSTESFPLNDSEQKCRNADGEEAQCSCEWKGKTLYLETIYAAHPTENGPEVEMHSRERLQLSTDRKTLTIRTETKAPQFPNLQMSEPTTEIYTRN